MLSMTTSAFRPRSRWAAILAACEEPIPVRVVVTGSSSHLREGLQPSDLAGLRIDTPGVVRRIYPQYDEIYGSRGVARVAEHRSGRCQPASPGGPRMETRMELPAGPGRLAAGEEPRSPLAVQIAAHGYHGRLASEHTTRPGHTTAPPTSTPG